MSPKKAIIILILLFFLIVLLGLYYIANAPKTDMNTPANLYLPEEDEAPEKNIQPEIKEYTREEARNLQEEMDIELGNILKAKESIQTEANNVQDTQDMPVNEEQEELSGASSSTATVDARIQDSLTPDKIYESKVNEMKAELDAIKKAKESIK